jgi:hypothetical protein
MWLKGGTGGSASNTGCQPHQRAYVGYVGVDAARLDELRVAIGEVEALSTNTTESYDGVKS